MPKITPVTINEFKNQLEIARESHLSRNEPIPEMTKENIYNVETCLKTPFQSFGGKPLYRGFIKKAAMLFYTNTMRVFDNNNNNMQTCISSGYTDEQVP